MHIRRYHHRDHDAVVALAPRLTAGVAPRRPGEAVGPAVRAWVDESLTAADDARPVFVADDARLVVGFATATTRRHWSGEVDAYLGELVVAEARATRGIGRALVAAVETWARASGYARITLETGAANRAGRAFYAALGYAEEEVVLTRALDANPGAEG